MFYDAGSVKLNHTVYDINATNRRTLAGAGLGFNAVSETYEPLFRAGVIDPAKVVRSALQNAASVASLLLTTEGAIAEKPEKKKASGGAAAGGDEMDDEY